MHHTIYELFPPQSYYRTKLGTKSKPGKICFSRSPIRWILHTATLNLLSTFRCHHLLKMPNIAGNGLTDGWDKCLFTISLEIKKNKQYLKWGLEISDSNWYFKSSYFPVFIIDLVSKRLSISKCAGVALEDCWVRLCSHQIQCSMRPLVVQLQWLSIHSATTSTTDLCPAP